MSQDRPFSSLERKLAWRMMFSMRSERGISLVSGISLLGIILGVAILLSVSAVMDGFSRVLVERIIFVNGDLSLVLNHDQSKQREQNLMRTMDRLDELAGIERATPMIEGLGMASAGKKNQSLFFRALRDQDMLAHPVFTHDQALQEDEILLGYRAAQNLGLSVGDQVQIMFLNPQNNALGELSAQKTDGQAKPFLTPLFFSFRIKGLLDYGLSQFDETLALIPYQRAVDIFLAEQSQSVIELRLEKGQDVQALRVQLYSLLEDTSFQLRDWRQANAGFIAVVKTQKSVLLLVLSIIIIVAALNIISGLIMLVNARRAQVAILRTMGMRQGAILRIFMMIGLFIGVIGTLCGLALGASFIANLNPIRLVLERWLGVVIFDPSIYLLSQLPVYIELNAMLALVAMTLALSLLAALLPAWQSMRIDPARGVRHD